MWIRLHVTKHGRYYTCKTITIRMVTKIKKITCVAITKFGTWKDIKFEHILVLFSVLRTLMIRPERDQSWAIKFQFRLGYFYLLLQNKRKLYQTPLLATRYVTKMQIEDWISYAIQYSADRREWLKTKCTSMTQWRPSITDQVTIIQLLLQVVTLQVFPAYVA